MTQRILQAAPGTLTLNVRDSDGTLTDASGTVTVAVAKADGTVVLAAGTAVNHGVTGTYTVALTAAQTASLNRLVATWTASGDSSVRVTYHEIVGGFYFSIDEARASDVVLTDVTKYPDDLILATRQEVEVEAERICQVAFVPRFRRLQLDGPGSDVLVLGVQDPKTVRSLRVYASADLTGSYTVLSASSLASLQLTDDGQCRRTDGTFFDFGVGNIVVELEHGFTSIPADLKRAALTRLRSRLDMPKNGVPDRATSFTTLEGETIQLATPSAYSTGLPDVDAVYGRYSRRASANGKGDAGAPASRPLNYDPQRLSLWHGGIR